MKIVAFMPIKMNNERLPNKNIKALSDGTPLMHIMLNTLLELKLNKTLDAVYVFCSDKAICPYIPKGVEWIQRPDWLDSQEAKCGDLIGEFIKCVDADCYVLAASVAPFVTATHIKECIESVKNGGYSSAFAAKKLQNFLWANSKPVNFSLDCAPRTQDMTPYYCELSTPYVFTKQVYEKYGGRTGENPYICECSEIECVDIDYPEDFELANIIYMNGLHKQSKL